MKKLLHYLVLMTFLVLTEQSVLAQCTWEQLGLDIDGEAAVDQSGWSVSQSSDGYTVAIGAPYNDGNGNLAGHVRVYQWNGSAWLQQGADIDGEVAGDQSGLSVSLSYDGSKVAIGAPYNGGNGSNAGHVRVYQWNGSAWVQQGVDIDGEAAGDYSGNSVSLSSDGETLAIGAPYNDGNGNLAGHVRVYQWNGSAWVQQGVDIDGEASGDISGYSVSLSSDGSMVAIGAPWNGGILAGQVRVYQWNGIAWVQQGADIDGEAANDNSGYSVSLSSDGATVAIGAYHNDGNSTNTGQVRVYQWNGSAWLQQGADIDGEAAGDVSGWSVSLSSDGNRVAIGARQNDGNGIDAGHVRVYGWNGASWVQLGADIDGEAVNDQSGWSVSLSSDGYTVAIGAPYNDGNGNVAGQVRVYKLGFGTPTAGNNGPVCTGTTLSLNTPTVPGATYAWTGPDNYSSTEQNPTVSTSATTAMGGTYYITVSNGFGCTSPQGSTTVTVQVQDPIVTTNANSGAGSLRQAVIDACPGSTITFDISLPNIIDLSDGQIIIDKDLTILGPGANDLTVQNTMAVSGTSRVFYVNNGVTAIISGLTISGGNVSISGAGSGGGILNLGTLSLITCTVSGNAADTWGAGIYNDGSITLTNSTISNNSTFGTNNLSGGGGGIFNQGSMTITGTTISGNTTLGRGGAVYNVDQTVNISNSSFSGNTALNGGGIFNRFGTVEILNLTCDGNTASDQGGGIWNFGGSTTLGNSIVSNNIPADCFGVITSIGHNIISDASAGLTGIGDLNSTDPMLEILFDNGGPTMTHALLPGSPAINAGDNTLAAALTTDQRGSGFPRIFSITVDIGAYEVQCFIDPVVINNANSGAGSLRQAVIDACPGSTITFDISLPDIIDLSDGQIIIDKNLTIQGPGATMLTLRNTAARSPISRIFMVNGSVTTTISGLTISEGNVSVTGGGGIYNQDGTVNLIDANISYNQANGNGGVLNESGTMNVTNSTISNNSSGDASGGGIGNNGLSATLMLTNSTVSNNSAGISGGGGISNSLGTVNLTNSTISGNYAGEAGGGGITNGSGTVSLVNSTVSNNTTSLFSNSSGAGIKNGGLSAILNVTNSTISDNTGGERGGGGITNFSGTVNLTNATISKNRVYNISIFGGGGILNNLGTVNSKNSIIAGNNATGAPDFNGSVTSQGYNLVGKTDGGSGWIATDLQGTIALPLDPMLGILFNNGGPTETLALLPGSPAIDAGNNILAIPLTTDQRGSGFPRISNITVDMGAYELQCNLSLGCPADIITANETGTCGKTVTYDLPTVINNCDPCTAPTAIPNYTYLGEFGGHKYFRSNFSRTWNQAKTMATGLGAHLVTLSSEAESEFVKGNGELAWIGLTDEALEGSFEWVTGESYGAYLNWWPGDPNNGGGAGAKNYVLMNFYGTSKWVDAGTNYFYPFIIEFDCGGVTQTAGLPSGSVFPVGVTTNSFSYTDASNNTVTCSFTVTVNDTEAPTLTCPANMVIPATSPAGAVVNYNSPVLNDNCYGCVIPSVLPNYTYLGELNGHKYFRSNFSRTWPQANTLATALGGHLVTITSLAENNLVAGSSAAWIGLTDEAVEGTFVWVNGEPYGAYTNWWPGEPNNSGGSEDYAMINYFGNTPKWFDYGTVYFYPFIVEFECHPTLTQTAGLPSGAEFPIGTTLNSFSYTDGGGNMASCSFTVEVTNMVPPAPRSSNLVTKTKTEQTMQVRTYPNPSAGDFNLLITSGSDEPITVRILDVTGTVKQVHVISNKTKTLKVGADLPGGIYMAEITQGKDKKIVKLVKIN